MTRLLARFLLDVLDALFPAPRPAVGGCEAHIRWPRERSRDRLAA